MLFSFNQFVKYKLHIGHSYKNTKLLSSWILYKMQNNIWIIDVFKAIIFLKNIFAFLRHLISYGFPIWFINLEMTKEFMFLIYSKLCGEYACTRYWVRGMLSNYISISKSIKKYGLKKHVYKSSIFLKIISNWYVTRFTWPRAIFLTNIDSNYIVCSEAISMFIPIIAVVDSNVKSYLVKLPIMSNDDSMESFYYIFNIISKLILLLKYKKLILWFFKYKRAIKELNFNNLISRLYNIKKANIKKMFKPLNLFNKFDKNLKLINFYYKKSSLNFKHKFNRKYMAHFNLQFFKKSFFLKKFSMLSAYSQCVVFNNRFNMRISKNIKKVLYTLRYTKYKTRKKYLSIIKYFSLYWTSFIYSAKNLRIFYNSFLLNKKGRNYKFLNLGFFYKFKHLFYNYRLMYFPFFFFVKKRAAFYKSTKNRYSTYSNSVAHKLFFYKNNYIKFFVELYYNKWFIFLLNSNIF